MESIIRYVRARINAAIGRIQPFVIFVMCTGILLAYLAGMYVTGSFHSASRWMGAMLACTSVVVVLQKPGYKESLKYGWTRVLGTLIGALVAYIYLLLLPFSVVGMLASVFLLEMLFMVLNIYNNGHIATITMLIIMLVSQMSPGVDPSMNCMLRFFESAVGVAVGVGLLWIIEVWNKWRQKLLHIGRSDDGKPVDMDAMPLRWGHLKVLIISSLGQATGAGLSTLIGVVLPMIQLLRHTELGALQQGAVAATSLVGIMIGSVLIGRWSDRKGYLFFFRLCPFIILVASVYAFFSDSLHGLVAALFAMGFGIGGGYSLDSDYVSEIMPRRYRLLMVGVVKAFSALGNIFIAVACFYLLRRTHDALMWNRFLLLISLLAFVMLLTRLRFVESPGWLMAHDRDDEAERNVRYFLGPDVQMGELRDKPRLRTSPRTPWREMIRGENMRKALFSGVPWFCEGVGVYGIGVFLPVLIMALGLGSEMSDPILRIERSVGTSVYINLFVLVGFAVGLSQVNRRDHIRMQTWGFACCAAGLGLLLAAHVFKWPDWLAVAGFMIFELFINAGPHLITFIIPAQIYSITERGSGTGLAAACGKLGAITGVILIPVLLKWGGLVLVLSVVMAIQIAGAVVTRLYGPSVMPRSPRPAGGHKTPDPQKT